MKKCCGTCKHRINGTDTHMVCSLRDYVLRVSRTDKCKDWNSNFTTGYVAVGQEYLMKCNWLECEAGCGIAGHGGCFRKGEWWKKNCKQFKKDTHA